MLKVLNLAVFITVLTGCASQPMAPVSDHSHQLWNQRQQQLSTLQSWDIRGRIALYINDEVHSLGLSWHRSTDTSNIKLEAPFNQGMVKLETSPSEVVLTSAEGETIHGVNAEEVLRIATGWSIPVQGLTSWITGINHNTSDHLPDIDANGRAISIQQDNWHINFLSYAPSQLASFQNIQLPRKIYMKHDNLALKIVVDQWQSEQPASSPDFFPQFPK